MRRDKDLIGYEGLYKVFEDGKVWSIKYSKFLKSRRNKGGYTVVTISKDAKIKCIPVHRLLYLNFIDKIDSGLQINHRDGNKLNNRLENLELVTPSQNIQHAWDNALIPRKVGEQNKNSKLTDSSILSIFSLRKQGLTQNEIAAEMEISRSNISRVLSRKMWGHVLIK